MRPRHSGILPIKKKAALGAAQSKSLLAATNGRLAVG
jgi:hypothetical protein